MIEQAIQHIPADDRDVWVKIAMSVKAELGEAGFALWDQWSQTSDRYRAADARAVWRSIKPTGGIGPGTLYALAKEYGWKASPDFVPPPRRMAILEDGSRHAEAAQRARQMIEAAELRPHPYLARKGFPDEQGLVLDDLLLVPMWGPEGAVASVQTITPDGAKKFLAGGRAKGATFSIGRGERWLCEGYATALSIRAALASMYRQACVVVCFSAGNLMNVSGDFVIADNDASGTGERYAVQTGLPYWMPPEKGDANDFHQAHGLSALAGHLRALRMEQITTG